MRLSATRARRCVPALVIAGVLACLPGRAARAQGTAPIASPATAVDDAQVHFRRGVDLYTQGDSAGALSELRRAYALAPNFRILFNLGQVAYQCHDYAAAFGYLTRYLTEGGTRIPEARRRDVSHDLTDLRDRVGYLSIEASEAGLRVAIDDLEVGTTPLAVPVTANAGLRRVQLVAPTGERQLRTIELAAGAIVPVSFSATPHPALPTPPTAAPGPKEQAPALPALPAAPRPPPAPRALIPTLDESDATLALFATEPQPPRERSRHAGPWVTWTLAAIAAAGAAATGALAWSDGRTLQQETATYPASAADLQTLHDRERRYALASDGLLAGAVVLSALALYFTLADSPDADGASASRLTARADW